MSDYAQMTLDYFRPPPDSFWRWADGGDVVEWKDGEGGTICYREDLTNLLPVMADRGFPPLSAVLLIVDACHSGGDLHNQQLRAWPGSQPLYDTLDDLGYLTDLDFDYNSAEGQAAHLASEELLEGVQGIVELVAGLAAEWKQGDNRSEVISLLNATQPKYAARNSRMILREFESGKYDVMIFHKENKDGAPCLPEVVHWLVKASSIAPDSGSLENLLKTGVPDLPEPIPLELPEVEKGDFLQSLEEDERTFGLATLTRRLMAAIHIPPQTRGSSDLPFGGVSDITNRGDFDRLLLSELAYDDTTLMARLANNEALYLRREEPPQNLVEERTILVDTTLKMWGLPRVFAISAALACAQQQDLRISAYALGGETHTAMALGEREGVLKALQALDVALHCGPALLDFVHRASGGDAAETVLITSAESLETPEFKVMLLQARSGLDYLITVTRSGDLEVFQYIGERRKPLRAAHFDLEQVLLAERRKPHRKVDANWEKPAFYAMDGFKLLFPTCGVRFNAANCYMISYHQAVLAVTDTQRLLLWKGEQRGAQELLPFIEKGDYYFGNDGTLAFFVVAFHPHLEWPVLYRFLLKEDKTEVIELPPQWMTASEVYFRSKNFYFDFSNDGQREHFGKLDPLTGETSLETFGQLEKYQITNWGESRTMMVNHVKRFVNNGYTVLKNVRHVAISENYELRISKRTLSYTTAGNMKWAEKARVNDRFFFATKVGGREPYDPGNPNVWFEKFVWEDGSMAISDSRGFLHLRSSNADVPELSIPLVVGKPTACWTSDEYRYGAEYFTNNVSSQNMETADDFGVYLAMFIQTILKG